METSIVPEGLVRLTAQANEFNMRATGKNPIESRNEAGTKTFVKQQLHAACELDRRRSRWAANAKHARMSSGQTLGQSARISDSVIPPARYSRISYTVMRVPLMQRFPPRTPGVMVMRSSSRMA